MGWIKKLAQSEVDGVMLGAVLLYSDSGRTAEHTDQEANFQTGWLNRSWSLGQILKNHSAHKSIEIS